MVHLAIKAPIPGHQRIYQRHVMDTNNHSLPMGSRIAHCQPGFRALLVSICLFLIIITWLSPVLAAKSPPRLFFSKSLKQNIKKTIVQYTIRKGEYLYSILRKLQVPEKDLARVIQAIKKLNPQLKDLSHLTPGQTLFLPPSLFSLPAKGARTGKQKIKALEYKVQPGDYLVGILRNQAHLPDRLIFNEALNLFKRLNPTVSNLNKLKRGDLVYLPLQVTTQKGPLKIELLSQAKTKKIKEQKPESHSGLAKRKTIIQKKSHVKGKAKSRPPKIKEKMLCLAILKGIGFDFSPGQELFYPTPGGWIQIPIHKTPLAKSPWGQSILFVPPNTLSRKQQTQLQASGISICPLTHGWKTGSLFVQLQKQSKRKLIYWQEKRPLILTKGQYTIELQADQLIIYKDSEPHYHLFFQNSPRIGGGMKLLAGFLRNQKIFVHFLSKAKTPHFVSPNIPPGKNIFLPKASLADLNGQNPGHKGPSTPSHPGNQADNQSLQSQQRTLSWPPTNCLSEGCPPGRPLIKVSLPVLVPHNPQDKKHFFLSPENADPYLVAAFNLQGENCLVLEH